MSKISVTLDNNAFFLVIVLVIFRAFKRKQRDNLKLSYLATFLIVILLLKFKIEDGFPFSFTSFNKWVFQLRNYNIASLCSTYNIASKFSLAITNLKYKDYNNFYQFVLLLSGDLSLNPGPVQISPTVNFNIWESLNKKGLHFLHVNISSLLPKIDELKCIANKTKAAIIGITESKLDILYLISKSTFQGMYSLTWQK